MSTPRRVSNPPNRFASHILEWLDEPPEATLEVYEERAKSILSKNESPDIGFIYSVNPYRGCFHGCAYCYARPTHQYLDFGAGTDFESKIVAKVNAHTLLRRELGAIKGTTVCFSGVTDCYQPLEASYELTRKCLEVCVDFKNPVGIITKGALIRRDLDVLQALHSSGGIKVIFSIAFSDDRMAKRVEPSAPRPSVRFRAMEALVQGGIPVGVSLAPVIPGLNDHQIPEVLELAANAGAQSAFMALLRLPLEVKQVFLDRISAEFPERIQKITNQIRDMKGGVLNRSAFGERMYGQGPRWEAIRWLFYQSCEKYGLKSREDFSKLPQHEASSARQQTLFTAPHSPR